MTTLSSLEKLYLIMNISLMGAYGIFILYSRLSDFLNVRSTHQQLMRWGQVLVLSAFLIPSALHLIPSQQMPLINLDYFQVAPEGSTNPPSTHRQNLITVAKSKASEKIIQNSSVIDEIKQYLNQGALMTAFILWVLGLLFYGYKFLRNFIGLRHLLEKTTLMKRLGPTRIVVSESTSIPFSLFIPGSRWIVMPLKMLADTEDFKMALKHELQHHRNGDTVWAMVFEVFICFFYLNPTIFLWKKTIIEFQEFSCDEALVGRRKVSSYDYGSCLVRVAESALKCRQMYAGTTCMATAYKNPIYFNSFLHRRIKMLIDRKKSPLSPWAGACVGTIAILFVVAIAYGAEQSLRKSDSGAINPGTITVDQAIQEITEADLREAVKSEKAASGFAIVADPNTGRILAVANIDTHGEKRGHWALSQLMEPASLVKTLVAAEAIEQAKTTPSEKISCENGSYKYGDRVYHDWRKQGWDYLTTEETIANSSDICTMKLGERLGPDGLSKMLVDFGFGPDGTAKAFPEAKSGQLPPPDNKERPRLVPFVSAGFGFQVTPLEMIQAYGAIANGGNLLLPHVATGEGAPTLIRRILSLENAEKMKEILRQVVIKGTAKVRASSLLYSTAGKTATSYVPDLTKWEILEGKRKGNFAGFIGFGPVKNPQIEIYVGIRDPESKDGAHGSTHAAPVFKRILEDVLKHLKVAPDKPQA